MRATPILLKKPLDNSIVRIIRMHALPGTSLVCPTVDDLFGKRDDHQTILPYHDKWSPPAGGDVRAEEGKRGVNRAGNGRLRWKGTEVQLLIIEDDPVLGRALQQGFSEASFDCRWAHDGERGLELAQTQ